MSIEEIRNYISFNFAAQNRAVTINDYTSKLRLMPSTFELRRNLAPLI